MPALPPPGFYNDPERAGSRRYWDGTTWAPGPPQRRVPLGVLVVGIISVVVVLSVVVGVVAVLVVRNVNDDGEQSRSRGGSDPSLDYSTMSENGPAKLIAEAIVREHCPEGTDGGIFRDRNPTRFGFSCVTDDLSDPDAFTVFESSEDMFAFVDRHLSWICDPRIEVLFGPRWMVVLHGYGVEPALLDEGAVPADDVC